MRFDNKPFIYFHHIWNACWRHEMETSCALLAPVNSPHKRQWRGALMFSLICSWINDWVNNREAGDLRRHQLILTLLTTISNWKISYLYSAKFAYAFWRWLWFCLCKYVRYMTSGLFANLLSNVALISDMIMRVSKQLSYWNNKVIFGLKMLTD